jgi:hypothetical protein
VTHGNGTEYRVRVPAEDFTLYRLILSERPDSIHFVSNEKLEKPRLWPGWGEDVAQYRGISAFETPELAFRMARVVNERLRQKGKPPRWTHVAEITVNGHLGHALARTRGEGHFSVWGEAEGLASSVSRVLPIPNGTR